jgi:hypothetical protein
MRAPSSADTARLERIVDEHTRSRRCNRQLVQWALAELRQVNLSRFEKAARLVRGRLPDEAARLIGDVA